MKLFITNKSDFENQFDDENRFNSFRRNFSSSEIHKIAYTKLSKSIDIDHVIPLLLIAEYDEVGEGICLFNFETKKGDIYYYNYTGTAN